MESDDVTVREACRRRMPLDGADAQALEGALAQVERDLATERAAREKAERERDASGAMVDSVAGAVMRAERQRIEREVLVLQSTGILPYANVVERLIAIVRGEKP